MSRVAVFQIDDQPWSEQYEASCTAHGSVISRVVDPFESSLWLIDARFEPGATLEWAAPHGDEIVYVLDGSIEVEGTDCGPDGAVVIESGVATRLQALQPSRIIHFGSMPIEPPAIGPLGPPAREGHGVHVLGADGIFAYDGGERSGAVYYADSSCPTCRPTLLRNIRPPDSRIPSHLHSEDELLYLLCGDAQIGRDTVGTGGVVAIPANHRYGLRSAGGCTFLNFRRDAAWMTAAPSHPPVLESIHTIEEFGAALTAS